MAASSSGERNKWILAIIAAATAPADSKSTWPSVVGAQMKRQQHRQHSSTLEFNDAKSTDVSLVYRKTSVQFRVEMDMKQDNDLSLSDKLTGFDNSRIVDLMKVNLSSRDKYGNVTDANAYSSASFLVSLNLLLREEILHQVGIQNIGLDDISPLLVNCYILAMVGLNRISLEIFDLIDQSVSDLTDVDIAIIDNHRALAGQAFDWCLSHKFVDKPLSGSFSIKIKIALYGFLGTGKTSVLFRYIDNVYNKKTTSTIGVDFRQKRISLNLDGSDVSCLVDVWDTAGQEKYRAMTSNFIKGICAYTFISNQNKLTCLLATAIFCLYRCRWRIYSV